MVANIVRYSNFYKFHRHYSFITGWIVCDIDIMNTVIRKSWMQTPGQIKTRVLNVNEDITLNCLCY